MTLLARESYVNETTHSRFGDSDWQEVFTEDRGKLFRFLQREYGRCVSKMYRTPTEGPDQIVGWVFQKRMLYEDARRRDGRYQDSDYYVREVWVELRDTPLCAECGKDEDAHHTFRTNGSGKECSPVCEGAA